MIKAHKIKLYPTKSQEELLRKSCGVARHSYNWCLAKWGELYSKGEKPSAYSLIKLQNKIKRTEFPFYLEVNKCAPQYACHNVESAFKKMWEEKSGYPKFKKKGIKDSFVAVENKENFKQENKKIRLPRIGWIKCAEDLRFEGKVNNVVVKRVADMWFAIVNIEVSSNEATTVSENQVTVGVDLGIKSLMVLSDGTIYENPKALKNNLKKLKHLQRGLSRKQKGSNNRKKQQMRVARKHYQIANIRSNAIHQATSEIVKNYDKIVIESLKPKTMVKNRILSQALSDASFGEISRQLIYKSLWANKELIKADQYFPSSKICSCCGNRKEKLSLSERTYKCVNCGITIDRDLNAAKNLANYSPTQESGGSQACGDLNNISSKRCRSSVKQEILFVNNN